VASGTYLPLDSDNECRPPGTRGGTRNEEREQACVSCTWSVLVRGQSVASMQHYYT